MIGTCPGFDGQGGRAISTSHRKIDRIFRPGSPLTKTERAFQVGNMSEGNYVRAAQSDEMPDGGRALRSGDIRITARAGAVNRAGGGRRTGTAEVRTFGQAELFRNRSKRSSSTTRAARIVSATSHLSGRTQVEMAETGYYGNCRYGWDLNARLTATSLFRRAASTSPSRSGRQATESMCSSQRCSQRRKTTETRIQVTGSVEMGGEDVEPLRFLVGALAPADQRMAA